MARAGEDRGYAVKAVFLYNFLSFTTWPDSASPGLGHPPTVCIYGEDPFGETLDYIQRRDPQGLKPGIRRIRAVKELAGCHVVFIGDGAKDPARVFDTARADGILTVGDAPEFAASGGMIGFVEREGKVKLQINPAVLARAGIRMSAKLLEMAETVE